MLSKVDSVEMLINGTGIIPFLVLFILVLIVNVVYLRSTVIEPGTTSDSVTTLYTFSGVGRLKYMDFIVIF